MKRRILFLLIFVLLTLKGLGQQFYVSSGSSVFVRDGSLIFVDLSSGTPVYQTLPGCGTYDAVAEWGSNLYYTDGNGILYSAYLSGSGTSQTVTNCTFLATPSPTPLTVDNNGILYFTAGNALYSLDPKNPQEVRLGFMPYAPSGDLAFFNGDLYMSSIEGIVKISVSDPSQSTLFIPLTGQGFLGLATTSVNGVASLYGFSYNGDGKTTSVYQFDMQKKTTTLIATLPFLVIDAGGYIPPAINITQECDAPDKGDIGIVPQPHKSVFTYTLKSGQSNTTGIFKGLPQGDYQVTITSDGWELPVTFNFSVPNFDAKGPYISPVAEYPVCNIKGSIKIDAGSDDANYKIGYNNQVFGFPHTFTGLDTGTYHFTILKPNGCIALRETYKLTALPCPPIAVTKIQIQPECSEQGKASVKVLTKDHPGTYTYTLDGQSNTTGIFDLIPAGTYQLTIVSSGDEVHQQVVVPDVTSIKPGITYQVKNAVCNLGGQVEFSATDSISYKISHGGTIYGLNESINGLPSGPNQFTVLASEGCPLETLSIDIKRDNCTTLVFPNAFTPNGDNINDIFRPNQDANPSGYKLSIYDRRGSLVFQSQTIFTGWDGKYNGKPAPAGVYYYVAHTNTANGAGELYSGSVALIR